MSLLFIPAIETHDLVYRTHLIEKGKFLQISNGNTNFANVKVHIVLVLPLFSLVGHDIYKTIIQKEA